MQLLASHRPHQQTNYLLFFTLSSHTTMPNSINNKFHNQSIILLLSLLLLLFPLVANSYNPDYNLAINCGSSTNTALDKRIWVGDNIDNTNLFTFIEPKTTSQSLKTQPNSLSNTQIPYTTARVSLSNFTYSFSNIIANSPIFLRLHFYPTSYQNFEPTNAFFSVEVNNKLTLLKNFNPSLWLHDDENHIVKEYCIQTKPNEKLNITFIPSNINQSNVNYAFINGIEVVSMPSFLYYTNLSDTNYHLKSLDLHNTEYQIHNDKALEMLYRINVGDNDVPPSNDTGMFRNWDNDFPRYLEKQYPLSVSKDFAHHLNYLKNTIPNYTAPESVYLTARSYGMNATKDYNVTWNFKVDSSFTYIVRLHFCEFDWNIKNPGDRVFQIFIANTLAEERADVIRWSGARMVPVHKDYVVTMDSQRGSSQIKRVNLSIKLQRLPDTMHTRYRDVTLNGIEILKTSDKNNNLFGSNLQPIISPMEQFLPIPTQKSKKSTLVIFAVAVVSCLMLASIVGMIVFAQRRRQSKSHIEMEATTWKTKNGGWRSLQSQR